MSRADKILWDFSLKRTWDGLTPLRAPVISVVAPGKMWNELVLFNCLELSIRKTKPWKIIVLYFLCKKNLIILHWKNGWNNFMLQQTADVKDKQNRAPPWSDNHTNQHICREITSICCGFVRWQEFIPVFSNCLLRRDSFWSFMWCAFVIHDLRFNMYTPSQKFLLQFVTVTYDL